MRFATRVHEATSVTSQNGRWQAMNNLADDMTEAEVLAALSRLKTLAPRSLRRQARCGFRGFQ
jgi:hypothetical protein